MQGAKRAKLGRAARSTFIHVISMATAVERRAEFTEAARAARSEWAFVDAATDAPIGLPYYARGAARHFGRALTRAEVGTFVSHFAAWHALLESGDAQRIVLEDDVLVDWRALDRLAEVDFGALGLDLVRLYATHPFSHRLAIRGFLGPHQHLLQARGAVLGGQGYILTRRAAERLVELSKPIRMPVDRLLSRNWELGFPNYCVFPFPLVERNVPSSSGERSLASRIGRADWLARQFFRARDRMSRELADRLRFRASSFPRYPDGGPSFVERSRKLVAQPRHTAALRLVTVPPRGAE